MTPQFGQLALSCQGLAGQQPFGTGVTGTLNAIEHLGYVQIDTLYVVERAHHHVLWSRVPGYESGFLNQLVSERKIFEYWFHAASYLPMRDYRFTLPQMMSVRNGENRYLNNVDQRLMSEILARVRGEGVLRVRDLDKRARSAGSWWNWGPGRRALEKLFMQGDLMVCGRNGMEKAYDLTERCLPPGIDLSLPTLREYAVYLFETTLRAHGVFTWKQLLHLKTGKAMRDAMREVLDERLQAGVIKQLAIANAPTAYVDVNALDRAPEVHDKVRVLSPFDNVLIHRERLQWLFDFDYRIECYVPAAKRRYGYFCLPILCGDQFAGRVDCKAHRSEGRFEVLSLHLEAGRLERDVFLPQLRNELQRLANFNGCPLLDGKVMF